MAKSMGSECLIWMMGIGGRENGATEEKKAKVFCIHLKETEYQVPGKMMSGFKVPFSLKFK